MPNFTAAEKRWIANMRRVTDRKPDSLRLYVLDGNCLIICKEGVDCGDLPEDIRLEIDAGAMLSDLHDDTGHGSKPARERLYH